MEEVCQAGQALSPLKNVRILTLPPPPLEKKRLAGGLYAVHCIKMGDFQEWALLDQWVKNSPDFAYDPRDPLGMGGCLEEHLNAYAHYAGGPENAEFAQLDLMTPIRKRN